MKYCPACHKTYPIDYYVCPTDQTGLQSAHELQPGMIIRNKYEILGRIGIGGMGVVYRGRHLTFNEVCAIKIVNDAIAGDANFLQRFQTEAVVTRKLRHPNAVRVDDFDYTDDGRPFIVMELVEGKNISEILHEEGPLRVPRAIRIATQAARALGVAHKLGIVHRDIKPGNIILATDEQGQETAKVLDFGIAKLLETAGDAKPGMTMTGMMVGTPLYMSPEQFMGKKAGDDIDGRTDIYSLGVVLYQMVTARLPFEGDTIYSLMMQHMEGNARPPHELVPELNIPESLSRVILKAIDKSREKRFQTAEEFIAGLDQVENDQVENNPVPRSQVANTVAENDRAANDEVVKEQITNVAPASADVPQTRSSQIRTSQSQAAQNRASQVAPTPPKTQPSPAPSLATPGPTAAQPSASPVVAPPSLVVSAGTTPTADSVLVKSAAQHVFLQPKKFRLAQLLALLALIFAAVLVAGVGYVKYQSLQRLRIESAVNDKLNTSQTLRQAAVRVFVSDTREVFLDGIVSSSEDQASAEALAASVPGVTGVTNRVQVLPAAGSAVLPSVVPTTTPAGSTDLVSKGTAFLDAGDYAAAIDCFQKASADPNNKGAKELLDRARRAQKTEEELLKNRR